MLPTFMVSLLSKVQKSFMKFMSLWSVMRMPMVYDPKSKRASVTATFAYGFFLVCIGSLFFLHKNEAVLSATIMSALCWLMATVLYMFRGLDKAKFDLNDKSVELGSSDSLESDEKQQRSE